MTRPEPWKWESDPTLASAITIEPERYELQAAADALLDSDTAFETTRRAFFQVVGAGLLVLCVLDDSKLAAQETGGAPGGAAAPVAGARLRARSAPGSTLPRTARSPPTRARRRSARTSGPRSLRPSPTSSGSRSIRSAC